LAAAVFLSFLVFFLPRQAASSAEITGDQPSPDTSLIYSGEDLYSFAEAYGEPGRAHYIRSRFTFDLIFPLAYAAFLTAWISLALNRIRPRKAAWELLNLFPAAGMLFDYLENIATSAVMAAYPDRTPLFQTTAPLFTLIKWFFVYGSFAVLFGILIWWGTSAVKKRLGNTPASPGTGD
jgi:uncharacterized membrane protein YhaH (DUF805 family)